MSKNHKNKQNNRRDNRAKERAAKKKNSGSSNLGNSNPTPVKSAPKHVSEVNNDRNTIDSAPQVSSKPVVDEIPAAKNLGETQNPVYSTPQEPTSGQSKLEGGVNEEDEGLPMELEPCEEEQPRRKVLQR